MRILWTRKARKGSFAVDKRKPTKGSSFWFDKRGTSAIEFSLFAGLISVGLLNTVDISIYFYQQMEVANATRMGAQAAWKTCDTNSLPAIVNCSGLTTAITEAVQSTSLGKKITLQSGSPSEGYYCVDSADTLQYVGAVDSRPIDCSATGSPSLQPVDYIRVDTTYSFKPIFYGISIAGMLPTPIKQTAWIRLD